MSYGKEKGVLCAQGPVSRRRGVKRGVSPTECTQEDFRNNLSLGWKMRKGEVVQAEYNRHKNIEIAKLPILDIRPGC